MPGLDRCVCVDFGFSKGFLIVGSDLLSASSSQLYIFLMQVFLNCSQQLQHFLMSNTLYLTLLHYAILLPEIADSLGSYA